MARSFPGRAWLGRVLAGGLLAGSLASFAPALHAASESADAGLAKAVTPQQWLDRMANALHDVSFRGRSIYLSGDQLTSVEILHGIVDGESWERVVHLSGEPAEILRKGDRVASLHPDGVSELTDAPRAASDMMSAGLPSSTRFQRQWQSSRYRLHEGPADRVAGRAAKRIDILPVDRYRYGLHLWLDDETALLLKSVIVDQRGRALDMFEFVSLDTGIALRPGDFEPGNGLKWHVSEARSSTASAESGWKPGWLPPGFSASTHVLRPPTSASFAQSYSDGLAAFTLFVEPLPEGDGMEGSRQHGATVAVSYRAPQPHDQWRVTVVGEIPLETAMKVASSIQRDSQDR